MARVANYGNHQIRRMRCRGSGGQGLPSQLERETILNCNSCIAFLVQRMTRQCSDETICESEQGVLVSISNLNSKLNFSGK